jgi:hypothetical protein
MSSDVPATPSPAAVQQQKINEFLRLLPVTLEIAGLPKSEAGRNFNEAQMELRAGTVRAAYKVVRQMLTDVATK